MKIKFLPTETEIEVGPGETVLAAATRSGVEIKSLCKGVMSCAECRVRIIRGEENILPPSQPEVQLIGTGYHIDGRRLSCQVRCFGDITVDLQEQIDRSETSNKKVRGYRSSKPIESTAVLDTMILAETKPKASEDVK
jgi:2Fe-2S ferredoxin